MSKIREAKGRMIKGEERKCLKDKQRVKESLALLRS